MKVQTEVAIRYAKALFGLSFNGRNDTVLEDLRKTLHAFTENENIKALIFSPVITKTDKMLVVEKVLGTLNVMDEVKVFFRLLGQKGRLDIMEQAVTAYEQITDSSNNVVRGEVRTALKVTSEEKKQIEKAINNNIKQQLILEYREDKNVIGGIAANVGSYSFDGSVKTGLKKLKESLKTTH